MVDIIKISCDNKNSIALKYFLSTVNQYQKPLPINPEILEDAIEKSTLECIDLIYMEMKKRNQSIQHYNTLNNLSNSFYNNTQLENEIPITLYVFEKYPELIGGLNNNDDHLKKVIPLDIKLLNLPNEYLQFKNKLFIGNHISFNKQIPIHWLINNYHLFTFQDLLYLVKFAISFSNKQLQQQQQQQCKEPIEIDKIVNDQVEQINGIQEKMKYLRLQLAIETSHESMYYSYLTMYDQVIIDQIDFSTLASFTFSTFSCNGLKYLIDNGYTCKNNLYYVPNETTVQSNIHKIVEFTKLYYENENHLLMNYYGWKLLSRSILLHCPLETIIQVIELYEFPLEEIYSFYITNITKLYKLIVHLQSINYQSFTLNGFKKDKFYSVGLQSNIKIDSLEDLQNLIWFFNHFKIKKEDDMEFYLSFSHSIDSIVSIELIDEILKYFNPNLAGIIFKSLFNKSISNLNCQMVKRIIDIDMIQFGNCNFKMVGDSLCNFKQLDQLLEYFIDNKFKCFTTINSTIDNNLKSKESESIGIVSFFLNLFKTFSFNQLNENCNSFSKFNDIYNIYQSEFSIIIFHLLISYSTSNFQFINLILSNLNKFNSFQFFKNDQNELTFKIDKELTRTEINYNLIIDTINKLLSMLNGSLGLVGDNESFLLLFQILFDILVQCKNVNLNVIANVIGLMKLNEIDIQFGFYHYIQLTLIKDKRLANFFLNQMYHSIEGYSFTKGDDYGDISDWSFIDIRMTFDKLVSLSFYQYFKIISNYYENEYLELGYNYEYNLEKLCQYNQVGIIMKLIKKNSIKDKLVLDPSMFLGLLINQITIDQTIEFLSLNHNIDATVFLHYSIQRKRLDLIKMVLQSYSVGKIKNIDFIFLENHLNIAIYLLDNHFDKLQFTNLQQIQNTIKTNSYIKMYNLILLKTGVKNNNK